jgi:hypothetical protein
VCKVGTVYPTKFNLVVENGQLVGDFLKRKYLLNENEKYLFHESI